MEDKHVSISRAQGSLTFPTNFLLIAAMNSYPYRYYSDSNKECTCSNQVITRCQKRISGPMLDWIDIHIEVPRVEYEKLSEARLGEKTTSVQSRVEVARQIQ
jgi:magnesium chelatase family protein